MLNRDVTFSWNFLRKIILAAAGFSAIWGIISFVYYWDPTRVAVKRLMANDSYVFEEIHPLFADFDAEGLVTIRTSLEAEKRRRKLVLATWDNPSVRPDGHLEEPVLIDLNSPKPSECPRSKKLRLYKTTILCELARYRNLPNIAEIWRLKYQSSGYRASVTEIRPRKNNGWIVFYHHGFSGTYHSQYRNIARLIEDGYSVVAFNFPNFGKNQWAGHGMDAVRRVMGPISATIDYLAKHRKPAGIAMIGFSAGGWATAMTAAMDSRIKASYTVGAPIYPIDLRDPKSGSPDISVKKEILDVAGYPDLFILGAMGRDNRPRRQLQIFNRYDRCCWRNRTALLYANAVTNAAKRLGGVFAVRIDESHARHKISRQAMEWILTDLGNIRS